MIIEPIERAEAFRRETGWRDVLVIGGGASGVLFAANLLRHDTDLRVTVIEQSRLLGCGIAYSTMDPDHLLNTRVHNMSAFPDDEEHLLRWLQARDHVLDRSSFIARTTYGSYLSALLQPWLRSGRLLCIKGNCVAVNEREGGVKITLDDGSMLKGAYAVLATGHVLPRRDTSGRVSGAWDRVTSPAPDATVMIVGTGLSMVDQLLSLQRAGHRGPIVAVSRRGLLPRSHAAGHAHPLPREAVPFGAPVSQILKWLRTLARESAAQGGSWRDAIDAIRPWVSSLWQNMSTDQRSRFLRHGSAWWEVHRHRIPPASTERLNDAIASGQLRVLRAAFVRAQGDDGTLQAVIRRRGKTQEETLAVARIIDCRGIRNDPQANATPLVADLLERGAARVDPLRIGLDVSTDARLISAAGKESERIFALGPAARATFWEITAIPDIRIQAERIARFIAERAMHQAA